MSDEEAGRALSTSEIDALHEALMWLAHFMAEMFTDATTTLAVARAAKLETRAYDRDATWRAPDNLGELQRTLIAEAAADGRLPELFQTLRAQIPGAAAVIDDLVRRCGRALSSSVQIDLAAVDIRQFLMQQQPESLLPHARPHAATRGDDRDSSDAQPRAAADHFETLRLDTAVPERVFLHQAFTLAAAVRQQSSPVLMRDGLPVTGSGAVDVFWPEGATYVTLRIRISAPDCTIHGSKGDQFRLLPGRDSPDFLYHLTPKRTGPISIFVTVYQEEERLGTADVDTHAGVAGESQAPTVEMKRSASLETPQPAGAVTMQVQSHTLLSVAVARALRGLHAVLIEYFRKDDEPLVMASQAGLDTAYIRMSDIVADLWWNVLEAAHGERRVADLVDVARSRVNRRAAALEIAYSAYAKVI